MSFVNRFRDDFPSHQGNDGMEFPEVPIAMVALVATAVSIPTYQYLSLTNVLLQLYAAIKEWESGSHRIVEFSSNAYLDPYNGHVNTLNHIHDNREDAFHVMMGDIYSQAM